VVYNIEVEGSRTYFVATGSNPANSVWVHNKSARNIPEGTLDPVTGEPTWTFNPSKDLDFRTRPGTLGQNYQDALAEAFQRTGVPKSEFEVTEWAPTAEGKSIPVEYKVKSGPYRGAQVNLDHPELQGFPAGPAEPHVGYQTPGKPKTVGHIILQDVPATRVPLAVKNQFPRQIGTVIEADSNPLDSSEINPLPVAATALNVWSALLGTQLPIQLSVRIENLPSGELGETQINALSADGMPTAATILISSDAAGEGWYVDPNPLDNSAFGTQIGSDAYEATGDSPAAGKYDLYTVLLHEIGHLLGIDPQIPGFVAHVGMVPGSAVFAGGGVSATFVSQADDLNPSLYPNDLMSLDLAPGERRSPSALDVQIIDIVRSTSLADIASGMIRDVPTIGSAAAATTTTVSNVVAARSAAPPTAAVVAAAVDQLIAGGDEAPLTDGLVKKRYGKIEHGKKVVKGPHGHHPVTSHHHHPIPLKSAGLHGRAHPKTRDLGSGEAPHRGEPEVDLSAAPPGASGGARLVRYAVIHPRGDTVFGRAAGHRVYPGNPRQHTSGWPAGFFTNFPYTA
jgi:hypothetical protein